MPTLIQTATQTEIGAGNRQTGWLTRADARMAARFSPAVPPYFRCPPQALKIKILSIGLSLWKGAWVAVALDGTPPVPMGKQIAPPVAASRHLSEGDGNRQAVVSDLPKYAMVWGFFGGKYPGVNPEDNKVHYAEQSALSDIRFKNHRPFYAYDIAPTTVSVGLWNNDTKRWDFEKRYADTDWQMSQADMDASIGYLVKSGLQYFNFIYYPNNNAGGITRRLFENSTQKRGVKAAFTVGLFGGDRECYPADNDYTRNLKHLVDCLNKDWYQKIDGKPIVFFYNNEADTLADLQRIRAAYGGELYEVFMESGYGNDYTFIFQKGLNARSWYYVYNDEANGNHSLESVMDDTYRFTKDILAKGWEVVPSFTIALDQRARQHYPGDGPAWNMAGFKGHPNSYYEPITKAQLTKYFNYIDQLKRTFPKSLKTVGFGTWDELSEGGWGCLLPKKRIDGSIDDTMIRWFGERYNRL